MGPRTLRCERCGNSKRGSEDVGDGALHRCLLRILIARIPKHSGALGESLHDGRDGVEQKTLSFRWLFMCCAK